MWMAAAGKNGSNTSPRKNNTIQNEYNQNTQDKMINYWLWSTVYVLIVKQKNSMFTVLIYPNFSHIYVPYICLTFMIHHFLVHILPVTGILRECKPKVRHSRHLWWSELDLRWHEVTVTGDVRSLWTTSWLENRSFLRGFLRFSEDFLRMRV